MMKKQPKFEIIKDNERCNQCQACVFQCANNVYHYDSSQDKIKIEPLYCVNCQRCVEYCPQNALKIIANRNQFHSQGYWNMADMQEIYQQANQGGILLSSMGTPKAYPIYFDHLLVNASQVTNPSFDPLREPM